MSLKIVKVLKNGTAIAVQTYASGELTVRKQILVNLRGNGQRGAIPLRRPLETCSEEKLEETLRKRFSVNTI